MNQNRLNQLLGQFAHCHILIIGDFFLDKYLVLDRDLSEVSLETGLEAYQVAEVRVSPGAAGTVANNLRALEAQVTVLGVIGDDGEGYELKRALNRQGVDTRHLLEAAGRFTPTYTKPVMQEANGRLRELHRLDTKNRSPLPAVLQSQVIERLRTLAPTVHGIVVADQVQEVECGVITSEVRNALSGLGKLSQPVIAADSRTRIGLFRDVILKPNAQEALAAVGQLPAVAEAMDLMAVKTAGQTLYQQTGHPVFVTMGAKGILVIMAEGIQHIPGIPVSGPLDTVGAGDSVMAGLMASLCCGATPAEAAWVGNLVASVTVQQVGVTGTATPEQVRQRNKELMSLN
jgi:rfaE bifunctional protein kinase chain/domain